ncbi:GNAT family N-acetyltransferase [Bdellovibrio sp. HCB337]|uniref:GNAT family N-acetyltransferase n=1 Tax=Bdellovibrio sp. HCB337 TaxID=3394358 RepID=UPI0039A5F82A
MFTKDLGNGFYIKEIEREELWSIQDAHYDRIFANRASAKPTWVVSEDHQKKIQERNNEQKRWQLRLGLFHKDEAVGIGWHTGYAVDPETYYMQNSVVIEAYQKQGLYSEMLTVLLERLQQEGFQVVTSTHHPNNAGILIPKLKQGFIITSTQFHERFRFLVEMKYFFNENRRKAYAQAIGLDL